MRLRITSVFYASSICPFLLVPIVLDRRSTLTLMMLHHPAFNRRIHKLAARTSQDGQSSRQEIVASATELMAVEPVMFLSYRNAFLTDLVHSLKQTLLAFPNCWTSG
jgi:hypothetical protein